jgi:hypothetical protein
MDDIVTELSSHSTDEARDVINAAQTILKGKKDDIRNLCKPWGVQLKVQKSYRPTDTIKQELKISLTKRTMALKRTTDASAGATGSEHAVTQFLVDDVFAETLQSTGHKRTSADSDQSHRSRLLFGAMRQSPTCSYAAARTVEDLSTSMQRPTP